MQAQSDSADNKYHLTTKEIDSDTGLYYFYARWYDSAVGRFVSADPIWHVNLYSYVKNNPINSVDPRGEYTIALPTSGIIGIGLAPAIGIGIGIGVGLCLINDDCRGWLEDTLERVCLAHVNQTQCNVQKLEKGMVNGVLGVNGHVLMELYMKLDILIEYVVLHSCRRQTKL